MAKTNPATIRAVADRLEPSVRRRFLEAVRQLEREVDLDVLLAAVQARDVFGIASALRLTSLTRPMQRTLGTILLGMQRSGVLASRELGNILGTAIAFDLDNPMVIRWARAHAAEFVTQIGSAGQAMVREVLIHGIQRGIGAPETARLFRDMIGLTEPQAMAVINYRFRLLEEGRGAEQVVRMAKRYARKLQNYRARVIARHEINQAANAGARMAWQQAADKGLLDRNQTYRRWSTARDERVCPICDPMHGQVVAFEGEAFVTGTGGTAEQPPAHIACRCSSGLVFQKPA